MSNSYKKLLEGNLLQNQVHSSTLKRWKIRENIGLKNLRRQPKKSDDNVLIEPMDLDLPEANGTYNANENSEEFVEIESSEKSFLNTDNTEKIHENVKIVDDHHKPEKLSKKDIYCKEIMFEQSNTSVWDVFNMVLSLSVRFNLSDETRHALLDYTKYLAGPKWENLDISKYNINQLFQPPTNVVRYVFYCIQCNEEITTPKAKNEISKTKDTICEKCSKTYKVCTKSENWFLLIDLEHQLRILLSNENLRKAIKTNLENIKSKQTQIENYSIHDIHNSDRYKNNITNVDEASKKIVLTLNVNTDGAPQFKSSKYSFWPLQCFINEVPVPLRFKIILLAGLWYTKHEPTPAFMKMYLNSFLNQIKNLMTEGISIMTDTNEVTTYLINVFSFPVDSVARPILQNRLQFNGYYGCSWCYAEGKYIGHSMKYLINQNLKERTHDEYLKDLELQILKASDNKKNSVRSNPTVKGVKGSSALSYFPKFDCIWGFPNDYMHSVLLGVTRQLWDQWINASFKKRLSNQQCKIIDERLISIKPPSEIHRVPRILKEKSKWKASEWRSWLLFYSLPCLIDILDDELLKSYALLVRSIHKLLCVDISEEDLIQCEIDLFTFVGECQLLYGESFMTFNVHCLIHLTQSVRENGPLWANSAFPFENNIYSLKQTITGPNGVLEQIANRTLLRNNLMNNLSVMSEEKKQWSFCKNLFNHRIITKKFYKTIDNALLVYGKKDSPDLDDQNILFNRCIYNNKVFHSTSYNKVNKTDNTYILLDDKSVARILNFRMSVDKEALVTIQELEASLINNETIQSNHIWQVLDSSKQTLTIPIYRISCKLVSITIEGTDRSKKQYLCMQPNLIEVQ